MTGYTNNLHPDLMAVLTQLEHRMEFELQIHSGHRDPTHNKDVGGVEGSEHTYDPAQGADVFCQRSTTRFKMVRELLSMGVRRIGIGNTFIHVGIAQDKPVDVMWDYYPNPLETQ
jgi:uncharacterized protein YcbK (DUF882 family)